MHELVRGIHEFQANVFRSERETFARPATGQSSVTARPARGDLGLHARVEIETGEVFAYDSAAGQLEPLTEMKPVDRRSAVQLHAIRGA